MKLICLDVGGSAIKYGIYDTETCLLSDKGRVPNTFEDRDAFLAALFSIVEDCQNRIAAEGIAVSYCGEMNHEEGILYSPGSYAFNQDLPLRDVLEERFGLPASVENDGNAAMLAEWKYGVLKEADTACMMVLGTGIAGSMIIDGKLHAGRRGFAGFFSMYQNSLTRSFGFDNSAVYAASVTYLLAEFLRQSGRLLPENPLEGNFLLDGRPFDGKRFFSLVNAGDPIACEVLETYAKNLAMLIMNVQITIEAETFALGGGISAQDSLIQAVRRQIDRIYEDPLLLQIRFPKPSIQAAEFGNDANLVGAAIWFLTLKEQGKL